MINLFTAFLAASVVNIFESNLKTFTLLAVFMPIVPGEAGNATTQTRSGSCIVIHDRSDYNNRCCRVLHVPRDSNDSDEDYGSMTHPFSSKKHNISVRIDPSLRRRRTSSLFVLTEIKDIDFFYRVINDPHVLGFAAGGTRLYVRVRANNAASQKVLEKNGVLLQHTDILVPSGSPKQRIAVGRRKNTFYIKVTLDRCVLQPIHIVTAHRD